MQKSDFLKTVENFIKKTGISETSFGIAALKQPNFVFQLKEGRECREATQKKVICFINNYQNMEVEES